MTIQVKERAFSACKLFDYRSNRLDLEAREICGTTSLCYCRTYYIGGKPTDANMVIPGPGK